MNLWYWKIYFEFTSDFNILNKLLDMNKIAIFRLFVLTILMVGCNKNSNTGKFVPATCPIAIPEGLEESGKFAYGYMEVPELHKNPTGKTIELAIAIHKCQGDSATHEPLVLVTGGPGMSDIDNFVPDLFGDLGIAFSRQPRYYSY